MGAKMGYQRLAFKNAGILLTVLTVSVQAQNKSFVSLSPNDTEKGIVAKAANVVPSARQLRWQELELTAFFHFGINTFTNKEWGDGKEDISEFNPTELDAGQWVKTAKEAGIKQVIITAKHHDGFCLWPSKFTEHSIKNTPYKNGKGDVVREVATACRQYGIGFGIYLSPWDRNSAYYGDSVKYNTYFENQLTELLTNYGKVDEVWFDGANGEGPNGKKQVYDFNSWYKLIRKLQPQAVIAIQGPDVRWVGTETGKGRITEWSVLPVDEQQQKKIADASQKDVMIKPVIYKAGDDLGSRDKIMKTKGLVWYPAETDVSIRPGWFYHPAEDKRVKTASQLMDIYFTSVGRNSVLLLNIPPDKRGLISDSDIQTLRKWKKIKDDLFANNLLKGSVITCSNGVYDDALLDDKPARYWTTEGADSTSVIEFTSPAPITFSVLQLQEPIAKGQRIERFSLQYQLGTQWKEIASGTTIGFKRLLNFEPVTADKIRLVISSSRLNPMLSYVGLFNYAANPKNDKYKLMMKKKQFLLAAILLAACTITYGQQKRKLVWQDEFNYKGLPDDKKWGYESGFVRNNEPQYYTTKQLENCRVENGNLIIEARKEEYPNAQYEAGSTNWAKKDPFAHYTSASLITQYKADWQYGRIEVRAKVASGAGAWPAIWMLGADHGTVKWPQCGEIDIMEYLGRDPSKVYGTVHYADSLGKYQHQGESPVVGTPADGYHIYVLEWYPDRLEFYYDNLKYLVFDISKAQNKKDNIFQKKFYLLLNLALGHEGSWAGPFNDNLLPLKYYVDYVRIYQ